ncbi:MAG: HyaD/HybD family hydrogenase maturation endopeptidase [Chloroflexi bacterium]|nr:HyaD/HybD family hydrogenase maturation endopeptidase [Chloroflexota bacterium]
MIEEPHAKTLVLGVGNMLMADEGVGVAVVKRLIAQYHVPEEVLILDGGTLGLDLLYYLEGVENLLIVDAVQADIAPGELLRLEGDDVPSFLSMKISPHQIGVPDMLFAAKFKGVYPRNIVLWGVRPELLDIGLELSPVVARQVGTLVGNVVEQLKQWGHTLAPVQ